MKSLQATLEWRIIAFITDFLVVFAITGQYKIAGSVALISSAVKTVVFYFWHRYRMK